MDQRFKTNMTVAEFRAEFDRELTMGHCIIGGSSGNYFLTCIMKHPETAVIITTARGAAKRYSTIEAAIKDCLRCGFVQAHIQDIKSLIS